ncbi:MAG: hypothetical protein K8S87_01080 [Planctomycetes bacterium]|nr:hypothetical protein [Planctomycetota bacterium]
MKRKLNLAIMVAIVTLVSLVIGCDNLITGNPIDFEEWMKCAGPKKDTTGDLIWIDFDVVTSTNPLPGDSISLNILIQNLYDSDFPKNPNIPLSGNIRIFFEDTTGKQVNAGSFESGTEYEILYTGSTDYTLIGSTDNVEGTVFTATGNGEGNGVARETTVVGLGVIGPEDWFAAEFVLPGLFADKRHVIVENITIPRTDHFPLVIPDPNNAPFLGPETVSFNVYGLLDAQDCIGERDETNNERIATVNSAAGTLAITNPYLPNLQIKYLQRTPTSPLPHTGGTSITEWEVLNSGIGPVKSDFWVQVFLSEDDVYDTWDVLIGDERVTGEIGGNTNRLIYVTSTLPYTVFRFNYWDPLVSFIDIYDRGVGDVLLTRAPPPNGPLGYDFVVYPCISGFSTIIALVDPDSFHEVREAVEYDNYSFQGLGGNGDLEATNNPNGPNDIELLEFRADNYIPAGGGSNVYDFSIRYSASIQYAENCSMAFYWSKNDEAQFGDYFCNRFWFLIQPGIDILMNPFGAYVWGARPYPDPGTYRFVMVMDDIYKFNEPDEDNNTRLSIGTVQVQ